jgi:hypothetical protein
MPSKRRSPSAPAKASGRKRRWVQLVWSEGAAQALSVYWLCVVPG